MRKIAYYIGMCFIMIVACVLGIVGAMSSDGVHNVLHECLMFMIVYALAIIGESLLNGRTSNNSRPTLEICKLKEDAVIPTKGSDKAAGLDLYANIGEFVKIPPHKTVKIPTGIAVAIPDNCFGAIYARSGLATKKGLAPANCVGVVDSDYRGEVIVALHNNSNFSAVVQPGDRIAQMVIHKFENVELVETDKLGDTQRGAGGFGSTGN